MSESASGHAEAALETDNELEALSGLVRGLADERRLAQERLAQAIRSATVAETVIEWTVDYTANRKAFGHTIADFQNTQFKLAELKTKGILTEDEFSAKKAELLKKLV